MVVKTLRDRNRLTAMQSIQETALNLFEVGGYRTTTIEDVAAASEVSTSTVYRYFGTKEGLILWDDYDAQVTAELLRQIPGERPLDAMRNALINVLGQLYDADNDRLLRRVRFMYNVSDVTAASAAKGLAGQEELATAFRALSRPPLDDIESRVAASVSMAALRIAVGEWQRRDGETPLADLLQITFDAAQDL